MKRTISLLLAVLMLATVAIGCGKIDEPAETTTAATTANTVDPAATEPVASETQPPEETRDLVIEKYNRDFVIYQAGNWGYKDFLAEDMTGEPINDAVYTMLSNVSEEFGVNFTTVNDSGKDSSG